MTGLTLAFGDTGGGIRKLIQIVLWPVDCVYGDQFLYVILQV